jgi:hypothetical protein
MSKEKRKKKRRREIRGMKTGERMKTERDCSEKVYY